MSYEATCTACGQTVIRSGASIRDAWSTSIMLLAYVPLALIITGVILAEGKMAIGGALLIGFVMAMVPGMLGLSIFGWIVGLFASIFLPRQQVTPEPRMTAADLEALRGAMYHGHHWKQRWNE
jgi:hypothetical protein